MELSESPKYSSKLQAVAAQTNEYEAPVDGHVRDRRQPLRRLRLGKSRVGIAAFDRHRAQRPVQRVGPAVVRATQQLAAVARTGAENLGALVRTSVDQHAHLAVGTADHQQRQAGDVDRVEITGVRHLGIVPQVGPRRPPQALPSR